MKNALLAATVILALAAIFLLIDFNAVTNEHIPAIVKDGGELREVHPQSSTAETNLLSREANQSFGSLRLISWPNSKPIDNGSLIISDDNGQSHIFQTSDDGVVDINPGDWQVDSEQSDFFIAGPRKILIKTGQLQTKLVYIRATFQIQILDHNNVSQPGLSLSWTPSPTIADIDKFETSTDANGIAHISLFNTPGAITIHRDTAQVSRFEFNSGLPADKQIKIFIPSENEKTVAVEIRDRESGDLIPEATISAGTFEKITSNGGVALLPTRWESEYPLFIIEADGYQGVNQQLIDGMPNVILMTKSAGLLIKVVDADGNPVHKAIIRPFPNLDTSFSKRNVRAYLPRWLLTDKSGYCKLDIEQSQALQIFVMHQNYGFAHKFIAEVLPRSTITITLRHQPPLHLSFTDERGSKISPAKVEISCRGIDARPKPLTSVIQQNHYSISNPAFLDVIRIQAQGYLPIILKRKTFKTGILPYATQDAGGELQLSLTATHPTSGTIVDETGIPQANQRFQLRRLLPGSDNITSETFGRWDYPNSGWLGIESVYDLELTTDAAGKFESPGLASGSWVAANAESPFDLPLGSGGISDTPFVIPHYGSLKIIAPGKTSVNLTVVDDLSGMPISGFSVRLHRDALLNGSVGFAAGRFGHWNGWVRNSSISQLEVAASGYRVQALNLEQDGGHHPITASVRLVRESIGKIVFVGPEAERIIGKTLVITDVGSKGMAMFGDSRWSHKFQVADQLEEPFPAPAGDGLFTIMQASLDSVALTFKPRTFSYLAGETITIQVVRNDG